MGTLGSFYGIDQGDAIFIQQLLRACFGSCIVTRGFNCIIFKKMNILN